MWGIEGLGLSPTQLNTLNTQVAAASGCVAKGRCPYMAIRFSKLLFPAVEVVKRMLKNFFLMLACWRPHIGRLRAAWAEGWSSVLAISEWETAGENAHTRRPAGFAIRWGCVFGPITALIATLAQYNWFARSIDTWIGPDGYRYQLSSDAG